MRTTKRIAATLSVAMLIGTIGCAATQPIVQRDDAAITTDVRARLAADAQASPLKIGVETSAGVVRLTGSVATDGERNTIGRLAGEVPGVRTVDNNVVFGLAPAASDAITR